MKVDEAAAAEHIGMSVAFLRKSRSRGTLGGNTPAPPYYKVGGSIKYETDELDQWFAKRRIDPAAQLVIRRRTARGEAA